MTRLCTAVATFALILQASTACALHGQQRVNRSAQVLSEFKERIDEYVSLRRSADDGTPALKETKDPAKIQEAQQALAARIRTARAGAKPGDIFTPAIATHFRRLLRPEARERGTKAAIQDDNPGNFPFKVNSTYPDKEPLATVPPNVLAALPELPEDIEYRFVNKHLILRDARANLIIDYLPNAIS